MRVDRSFMVLLAAAAVVVVTSSAGLWQLDRARQKQDLHDAMVARQAMAPLDGGALPCNADDWAGQQHRPARLQGRWLHEHTVYLDNRVMAGRAGFVVLTPLMLDDSGECEADVVLVQRGWVPRDPRDRALVPDVTPSDETVTVDVRLAAAPSRLLELGSPASGPQGALRQNVDVNALAREWGLDLRPGSVQQLADESPRPAQAVALQRHWWQPSADVGKHQAYAAQWFAMATIVAALYAWFHWWRPWRAALS